MADQRDTLGVLFVGDKIHKSLSVTRLILLRRQD